MPTRSPHVADPSLTPFLRTEFDAADYLNYTLPALTSPSSLATLSSETQNLLGTLNTQATRLTSTLTQLTDEILRSGSRLAYQVDVLRGESISLNETLNEKLKGDIDILVAQKDINTSNVTTNGQGAENETYPGLSPSEPTHIARLRLLSDVRLRLDAVIHLFGAALAWPTPPTASSFISVSAPPTSEAEEKSKEHAEAFKAELQGHIAAGDDKAVLAKLEQLKALLGIWKGTAEEKLREKFVGEVTKIAEDRIRERDRDSDQHASPRRNTRNIAASRTQQDHHVPNTGPYLDGLI